MHSNVREIHAQGWDRLFALVQERNELLRQLKQPAIAAMELTPASGMVGEVDTVRLRMVLDRIDALTPQIDLAMEQHNAAARQIAKPEVRWQRMGLG